MNLMSEHPSLYIEALVNKDTKLLFVGINPTVSPIAQYTGRFFSGRGNRFWKALTDSGNPLGKKNFK